MNKLIKKLKESGEDMEFYPTTDEILNKARFHCISANYNEELSILDIGAGNGKALLALKQDVKAKLYAIEKSSILVKELLEKNINVIGTDFDEQSLFDKKATITFCNPPYSKFKEWMIKIIQQSNSKQIFFVVPERWENDQEIEGFIEDRGAKYRILGNYSFEDAEDRTARANVHLISINIENENRGAFKSYLDSQFSSKPADKDTLCKELNELIDQEKKDFIPALVAQYNLENKRLSDSFEGIKKLDFSILKTLNIDTNMLSENIMGKLNGLKNKYWARIFDELKILNDHFTYKTRQDLRRDMMESEQVDFTESNILMVVNSLVANAGLYIERQIKEVWECDLLHRCNIENYKSNKKFFDNDEHKFRDFFREGEATHIRLSLRCVVQYCGGIGGDGYSFYTADGYLVNRESNLSSRAQRFISDLRTLSINLGWTNPTEFLHRDNVYNQKFEFPRWESNKKMVFEADHNGEREVIFEAKAFINQNIHIKFNKQFLTAINTAYGKIKGWLISGDQAVIELNDKDAKAFFKQSIGFKTSILPALGYTPDEEVEEEAIKAVKQPKMKTQKKNEVNTSKDDKDVSMDDLFSLVESMKNI